MTQEFPTVDFLMSSLMVDSLEDSVTLSAHKRFLLGMFYARRLSVTRLKVGLQGERIGEKDKTVAALVFPTVASLVTFQTVPSLERD